MPSSSNESGGGLTAENVALLNNRPINVFDELFPNRARLNEEVSSKTSNNEARTHGNGRTGLVQDEWPVLQPINYRCTSYFKDIDHAELTSSVEDDEKKETLSSDEVEETDCCSESSEPIRFDSPALSEYGYGTDIERDEEMRALDDEYAADIEGIFASPSPPPVSATAAAKPTSTHHPNYDPKEDLRVVQWNVNGLNTATKTLWNDIVHGSISALLIQEQLPGYVHAAKWRPIDLDGYHRYEDDKHKTAIYIRDGIKHRHIKLKLHSNGPENEDRLHATAVAIRIRVNGDWRYLLLLSVYKSPNGNADLAYI